MPPNNRFRHQTYTSAPPVADYRVLRPELPAAPGSEEFVKSMRRVGAAYRDASVARILLVHGTFAGTDVAGVVSELERLLPGVGQALRDRVKRAVDVLAGDAGNFTLQFSHQLERAINDSASRPIPVGLFHWSGENHHLSRADAALRLIDELVSAPPPPGSRMLLWGHSHAGNVFALVTNLLAGDAESRRRFFHAVGGFYRHRVRHCDDLPLWKRTERLLQGAGNPLAGVALDFVTLGTPIRYGWDTQGYGHLLHFVHHRPGNALPEYRAPFPLTVDDLRHATPGDCIQQLGVAGTNLFASALAWRGWRAEKRMGKLLQRGVRNRDVLQHLKAGMRVPHEGSTLLVDYGHADPQQAQRVAGHAVYTRLSWQLFHAEEVARRLYGLTA